MNIRIILLSLLLISSVYTSKAQEVITLPQCYEWANANYPKIRQYALIDQTEQYQLSNINKAWVPQLSLHAQATYQSEVTQLPFDQKQLSALIPGVEIPTVSKDQYRVVAQLDQTIWDGGQSRSSRSIAKAEAQVERKALESELYAIRQRINHLYFGCLLQKELIQQNQILQHDLNNNIQRIRAMMDNGEANSSDLDAMQVELLNARQHEIELRSSMSAYRHMLAAFIGRTLHEKTILTAPALPDDFHRLSINRPELFALQARSELLNSHHRQLTSTLMPRLSAFIQGGYGRPAFNMLSNDFEGFYLAGIRLSWNIGRLYTLKNDRRKIEIQRNNIDVQRETFLFNTRLQLHQQDADINKMQQLMKTDEDIIRLRNNVRKASEIKLENGVIAVSDLIRDINAENQARQTAAVHYIQHLMNIYSRMHTTN